MATNALARRARGVDVWGWLWLTVALETGAARRVIAGQLQVLEDAEAMRVVPAGTDAGVVTASFGVLWCSCSGPGMPSADALYAAADLALYESKHADRNGVVVHDSAQRQEPQPQPQPAHTATGGDAVTCSASVSIGAPGYA